MKRAADTSSSLNNSHNKKKRVYSPAPTGQTIERPIPPSIRNITSKHSNIVNRLFNRQTSQTKKRNFQENELTFAAFSSSITTRKNYKSKHKIIGELDTHDPRALAKQKLSFLMHRSPIVEIISSNNIIFTLTQSGICIAFDRFTMKRICFLNVSADEVVRSLFYNKTNQSIITVSVYRSDQYSSLRCRTTPIEYIKRNTPKNGFNLFENEPLKWPGFVEFDDVNGKVMTYSAETKLYKVWDLKNYDLLYEILNNSIQEIKISPGIMLIIQEIHVENRNDNDDQNTDVIRSSNNSENKDININDISNNDMLHITNNSNINNNIINNNNMNDNNHPVQQQRSCYLPFKLINVKNGKIIKDFRLLLKPNKKLELVEQFDEKILVKQEHEKLIMYDVRNDTQIMVDFRTPSAFIFLYEHKLFLTFIGRQINVWNFKGEKVVEFEDHELYAPDCNTNNLYITIRQDTLISVCRRKLKNILDSTNMNNASNAATINISNILTGKCLTKISIDQEQEEAKKKMHGYALKDVTSLHYEEKLHELYTGNKDGKLFLWSV